MAEHHAHGGALHHDGTTGVHGMLLFGDEVLYLSHLPMFAPPHNFQVLLEVELDEPANEAYRSDCHVAPDGIYTFVPEPFPIAELHPGGGEQARTLIDGAIFRGHFERGGVSIVEGVVAQVTTVARFAELDLAASRSTEKSLTYLCFGRPDRIYLAHEITARPDFDQVLTARLVPGSVTDQAGRNLPDDVHTIGFERAQPVAFGIRNDTPDTRLAPGEIVDGLFFQTSSVGGLHGFRVQVECGREIYMEVGDLA